MTDILYLISESPSWTSVETHTGVYKPSPALTIPGFSLGVWRPALLLHPKRDSNYGWGRDMVTLGLEGRS